MAKNVTKFDLRDDKAVRAMKQCYLTNGKAMVDGYNEYIKKAKREGKCDVQQPYTHMINFKDKSPTQLQLIYRGHEPNLYDIWQELLGLLLHMSIQYNMRTTFTNTLDKWKYVFVMYGPWESEREKEIAGMDMMKLAKPMEQ